jgi:hypothetical protein
MRPQGVTIAAYLLRRSVHSLLVLVGVLLFVFALGRGIVAPATMRLSPDA